MVISPPCPVISRNGPRNQRTDPIADYILVAGTMTVRLRVRRKERLEGREVDAWFDHGTVRNMKNFTAVVERDPVTGLLVGIFRDFPGRTRRRSRWMS